MKKNDDITFQHTQWSRRRQAPKVKNAALSSKIDYVFQVEDIKIASLDKSYAVLQKWADSAYGMVGDIYKWSKCQNVKNKQGTPPRVVN